jgi:hypothetical protein
MIIIDATWAQNIILVVGLSLTIWTINSQYSIARKQSTLQKIEILRSDQRYYESIRIINSMRSAQISPTSLITVSKDTSKSKEEQEKATNQLLACIYVIGNLDLIAMGIRLQIIDEDIFKNYYFSTFIVIVDFLENFISIMREQAKARINPGVAVSDKTLYQDTLWLLARWKLAPLKTIKSTR